MSLKVGIAINAMATKRQRMPEMPATPNPGITKTSASIRAIPSARTIKCHVLESSRV